MSKSKQCNHAMTQELYDKIAKHAPTTREKKIGPWVTYACEEQLKREQADTTTD